MRCKCGEYWGHHRGLRPGHLFKGWSGIPVARELGRAESFLARQGETGEHLTQIHSRRYRVLCRVTSLPQMVETQSQREQGIVCGATSEQSREERSAVLVDLITEGRRWYRKTGKVGK